MSKQHNLWKKKLNDECQGKVDDVQHQTESRHGQLSQHMNAVLLRDFSCSIVTFTC
jgi:hypothetical protein